MQLAQKRKISINWDKAEINRKGTITIMNK